MEKKEQWKKYRETHKEELKKKKKKWDKENADHVKEYSIKNKGKRDLAQKKYREAHREELRAKRDKEYHKKYFQENKESIYEKRRENLNNPNSKIAYVLRNRFSSIIRRGSLKFNGSKTKKSKELLGCSIEYFKEYIESLFEEGMTWENHGEWHFDHIRPIASFDLTNEGQVKECFYYINFQPLWAKDNLSKGSKFCL